MKTPLFLFGLLLTVIILSVIFGCKKSYENFGQIGISVGMPGIPNSLISDNDSFNTMFANDTLISSDGEYTLRLEPTGDLSIHNSAGRLIWNINIYGKTNPIAKLNSDGSFSLYDRGLNAPPYWSTGANGGNQPFRLTMQKDGNLVIYGGGAAKKIRWSSNSVSPIKNNASCTKDNC